MSGWLIAVIAAVVLLLILFIAGANAFRRTKVMIEEAKKNVDKALGKRYDTISAMAKAASAYARHEKVAFTELVKVRSDAGIADLNAAARSQDRLLSQIRAVGEAYPELRSSDQYLALEQKISSENDQLAAAKRVVNGNISAFNKMVVTFPKSMIAGICGYSSLPFLEEENLEEKRSLDGISFAVDEAGTKV